ncbi:BCCT family transporter [Altererythrobacter sp. MTPC7]|uniref:BCCT family transporter n=1 Tax=Altererythrobacter sp. MTPC7 TaxID=3056567 RepID=UPI0036F3A985
MTQTPANAAASKDGMEPPLCELPITIADGGFYHGFNKLVSVSSKVIVSALILWTILFPVQAGETLAEANATLIREFAGWYVYLVAFVMLVALVLALLPQSGSLRLGAPGEEPEFSRFSWFAMLFGAGIGVGMLTYSTGEPLAHFAANPDTIRGVVDPVTAETVSSAYRYTFLHWGFAAWATYALVGLAVGYVAYRRGLPLTIRSSLAPLFGLRMSGFWGHLVDLVAVVATVLGVAVTMSFGVEQFVAGLNRLGMGDWLLNDAGTASAAAIVIALVVLVGASTLSAISGVGRGIKWLSNLNMALSVLLLAVFLLFGIGLGGITLLLTSIENYLLSLPADALTLYTADGTQTGDALAQWQLDWSVFYWAWWIAFAPFVGMFIARVSRGRTIREYVLGVVLVPSLMCFIWMALAGGTSIELVLDGSDGGAIMAANISDQLYATLDAMFDSGIAAVLSGLVVVLLTTYLITSADSAILIVNTINGAGNDTGGDNEKGAERRHHILFWGAAIALVVGSMLILGGTDAIQITMILGALPFSLVVALMAVSILKAVIFDVRRKRDGVETHCPVILADAAAKADGNAT